MSNIEGFDPPAHEAIRFSGSVYVRESVYPAGWLHTTVEVVAAAGCRRVVEERDRLREAAENAMMALRSTTPGNYGDAHELLYRALYPRAGGSNGS